MTLSRRALVLVVDPVACDAHGLCAELLPEWVHLDDWGYPVIDGRPLPADLVAHAKRAVTACPVLALRLAETARDTPPRRRPVGA
jgi:ferredoxin